jgi:hypothetical protein
MGLLEFEAMRKAEIDMVVSPEVSVPLDGS